MSGEKVNAPESVNGGHTDGGGGLDRLEFRVSGRIGKPCAEVYDAVADPTKLSRYFTTGGALGRLETGAEVTWDFADFPGRFAVRVVEAQAPQRIVIEWGAQSEVTADGAAHTTTTFEFAPIDGDARTLVTISETGWRISTEGARSAFGNCEGWTGMLGALKAWVEYGINLRDGFYA